MKDPDRRDYDLFGRTFMIHWLGACLAAGLEARPGLPQSQSLISLVVVIAIAVAARPGQ